MESDAPNAARGTAIPDSPLIILFARAPQPGKVKTRLIPALGPEGAADLHSLLVTELWKSLAALDGGIQCELYTDTETAAWPSIQPRRIQCPGDLGARMLDALAGGLARGHSKVMILGSDVAGLPVERIARLLACPADVALGPAEDGGYYAIACRRTHPGMFAGVRWSTANALLDTVRAVAACGFSVGVGEPWFDIDTPDDVARLPEPLRRRLPLGHP